MNTRNTIAPAPATTADHLQPVNDEGHPLFGTIPVRHSSSAMVMKAHGGGCCGISVACSMGYDGPYGPDHATIQFDRSRRYFELDNSMSKLDALRRILDQHNSKGGGVRVLEVVVTNRQCDAGEEGRRWPDELAKLGFKEVSRFDNSNSSYICRVFHYSKCPFFAEFQAGKKVPENKELTVVKQFYTPLFRDGRRGAICDSSGEVRAVAPLVRRYSLVSIMSDGSVTYVDEDLEAARPPLQGA